MKILAAFALLAALPFAAFARDASEIAPLPVGAPAPNTVLQDLSGDDASLASILGGKKTVVVFYRGGWCPYCNRQLQELATIEQTLVGLGYQIIAISPDSPESLAATRDKQSLAYSLYSDSEMKAAAAFGIDFDLPAPKANLEKASGGKNATRLPVPSVFLIAKDGRITFAHADPDFKTRLSAESLLEAAKR